MGNVAKEPRLSDLLFSIDMERQHDEVSALLDNLPPDDLESSLSNIDLNLFLGENGADIPVDHLTEDSINNSSSDSDEFKNFFNGKRTIKTESASQAKSSPERRNKKGVWNKKSLNIKKEILEDESKDEALNVITLGRSKNVDSKIKCEETSPVQQNDESTICNSHKNLSRKRKKSELHKKNTKPNKNIKIVIKYKKNPSEEPKAVVVSASTNSTSTDYSSPYSDESPSPSSYPFDFSFADIPDSFSTSIAEKVKTRTRNKSCSLERTEHNVVDKKPAAESVAKKIRGSPVSPEKTSPLKKNPLSLSPRSVSYHINKTKEKIQKKLLSIKKLSASNNASNLFTNNNNLLKNSSNKVPSLSLMSCNDVVLDVADNFINKKTVNNNNNVIASKIKSFHDYSKSVSSHNKVIDIDKAWNSLYLVPNESKSVTLRSDTNHTSSKLKAGRASGHQLELIKSAQEPVDVPVSMAEVEIASFEDSSGSKSPYSLRNSHFSDSSPKKPVVLLTHINNKRLLNSPENPRNRHCSTEMKNSSHHSTDPLSPTPASNMLERSKRSGLKSKCEQSDFMCNTKVNSIQDKFDCDASKDGNYEPFQSLQSKARRLSLWSESPKKDSSNALFTLRPSTRSQTKSSESPNAKLKRESTRLHHSEEKREENDVYKPVFDNRKAIAERRVMYVGKIPSGFTEETLLQQFSTFGEIENIQIKVRESEAQNDYGNVVDHEYADWSLISSSKGINKWEKMYGFITFKKHSDVARAIEEGQKQWPGLKLNFGGRREFVKVNYSDLDGNFAEKTEYGSKSNDDFDFARELKAAQLRRGLAYK